MTRAWLQHEERILSIILLGNAKYIPNQADHIVFLDNVCEL